MFSSLLCRRFCLAVRLTIENKFHGFVSGQKYFSLESSKVTANLSPSDEENTEERKIGVSKEEQKILMQKRPSASSDSRLLKVAILGAPNAGKSTLANKLIGWKFAPVSQKVHTTRHKTVGVLTEDNKQVIFLDTPGVIGPGKMKQHKLEKTLLIDPHSAVFEADLLAVIVDVSYIWNRARLDAEILKILHFHSDKRSVLVMNKVDLVKEKQELLTITRNLTEGIVGGEKSWTTAKHQKKVDLDTMFEKMKLHKNSSIDNSNRPSTDRKNVSQVKPLETYKQHSVSQNTTIQDDDLERNASEDDLCEKESSPVTTVTVESQSGTVLNLHSQHVWSSYYGEIERICENVGEMKGWQNFDRVFMISALNGDGVYDLRDYLLNETYCSPLSYHPSVVTDQNPVDLARLCVFERMLDHLPDEIPYQVKLKLALWEVTEDDLLRVSFEITCAKKRHLQHVLGKDGQTVRKIAAEAKQQLMNAFRREMSLQLLVKGTGNFYKNDEI